MKDFPRIVKTEHGFTLLVDGQPFLALGGEFHNSAASDPFYMAKHVWPVVDRLGGTLYLAPVYWECIEAVEGVYDFTLVDELLYQARVHEVRLGLLWFGMWKGPDSLYIPLWLKGKITDDDYQRDVNGRLIRQLSPFSDHIVEADRRAYAALLEHLRDYDGEERTVVLMQVENEPGTWFHKRDYSHKAQAAFEAEIPPQLAETFGTEGSWQQAFGEQAEALFMCHAVSSVVNRIAQTGKDIYPLPTFTNCVPAMGFLRVAGGPSAENAAYWKKFAPAIDVLTPNVYDPDFAAITNAYKMEDNPLMVPETAVDKDLVSKLIYTVGSGGLMYSPFGIEDVFGIEEDEYKVQLPEPQLPDRTGSNLAEAYRILQELYPEILKAEEEGRLHAILQGPEERSNIPIHGFGGMVRFKDGDKRNLTLGKYRFELIFGYTADLEKAPRGAAILLEEDEGKFLFFGVNICARVEAVDPAELVFVEDLQEYVLRGGRLVKGRILSGDERSTIAAGAAPTLVRFTLAARR